MTTQAAPAPEKATFLPSGAEVTIVSTNDDGEFFMVRSVTQGNVFYAHKNQLRRGDTSSEKGDISVQNRRGRRKVVKPTAEPVSPSPQKVNLNLATPELITQTLKGVGMKTATEIKELQQSMPGEKFRKLDQIRQIGGVDWDIVLEGDPVYVE